MMKTYGYIRVSATDQNEDRQIIAMENAQVPRRNATLSTSRASTGWDAITRT